VTRSTEADKLGCAVEIIFLPQTDGDVVAREFIDGAVEGVFERRAGGEVWYRHPVGGELLAAPSAEVFRRAVTEWEAYQSSVREAEGEEAELAVVDALRDALVASGVALERDDSFWAVVMEQAETGLL
jgi:hypothetical protein